MIGLVVCQFLLALAAAASGLFWSFLDGLGWDCPWLFCTRTRNHTTLTNHDDGWRIRVCRFYLLQNTYFFQQNQLGILKTIFKKYLVL